MHLVMAGVTAPSHVYPSLALICELVSRGHRVNYVVGERLAEVVAATGADVVTHASILPDDNGDWPDDVGEAMQVFLDEAIAVLGPLLDRVERPDAVLYDIGGFAGRVAAVRWGVPAVQLSPTYVTWEGYEHDTAEQTAALKASPSGTRYYATLRAWLTDNGVQLDADAFLGRPDACVVLIPRVLQPNADRVGPRYVFAGPCIAQTRRQSWVPAPGDDRPRVYVSFGTAYTNQPDVYRLCVEELAGTHRLVLATGKVDPAALGSLPHGVHAARTQPQLDVLEHASVFITHAGMGGAVESLWFGVPTVAIPQAVDQFANAARLEAIGAGVQLPTEQLDGDSLRAAVDAAAGRTDRAHELRADVRSFGGAAIAADTVERLCR
ncbi:MAG: UDP glycosyltransferase [Actinomycetota bacterium]|nr:UDP glycosyltransferase [Actinomycetota bacterium]